VTTYDVAIVGSGFGGSILSRALNRQGLRVALVERGRHPRFAVGESSTPLAALSLERLAADYQLPDLRDLAAHGRWQRHLGHLGCGLKRGFTFYDHRRGDPGRVDRSSLLVAASPDDSLADCHWLRADVDHHLVTRAAAEGVAYFDQAEVIDLTVDDSGATLALSARRSAPDTLRSRMLVDATGPGGLVRRQLGLRPGPPLETRTGLVFGHFAGVEPLDVAPAAGAPYRPHQAAVHHLIDEGWIYELRFDDGRVSAGALLVDSPSGKPEEIWATLMTRYPWLGERFARARQLVPLAHRRVLQHRMSSATGPGWVALPHTFGFVDPLFSTGIAWTLRGVERLARALAENSTGARDQALARYDALLQSELSQIDALVVGAYAAMRDFELFATYCLTYFATVSWAEIRQRLLQPDKPMWEGFLGCDDAELASLFEDAAAALPAIPEAAPRPPTEAVATYRREILQRIESRDLAGLDLYGPELSVPIDLDLLVARAHRLALDPEEITSRLHLLRGDD